MSPAYRRLLKWARTVHVYLTLFGLVVILFFAVTGFMLNHEDWFGFGEPRTRSVDGTLSTAVLNPVDRLAVVETLRNEYGVTGAVDTFKETDDGIEVVFTRPGLRVVAEAQREGGKLTVVSEAHGLTGVLTDLHKGKSAGRAWGLVIDATCVLLVVISATGLVLWSSLRARGKWGFVALILGLVSAASVYFLFVP